MRARYCHFRNTSLVAYRMRWLLVPFVSFVVCLPELSGHGVEAPTRALTLSDCIRLAIEQSTTVLKSKYSSDYSAEELLQSYGRFLPTVDLAGTLGYQTGKTLLTFSNPALVDQRSLSTTYQLTSTLNIFNGLADQNALNSALKRRDAAASSLERARQAIAVDVTQSFLQLYLDKELMRIATKTFEASKARQSLLQGQKVVGSVSPADFLRQVAQTSADEAYTITTKARLRNDEIALIRKLRLDATRSYMFADPQFPLPAASFEDSPENASENSKAEALIRRALTQRPDLISFRLQAEAAERDVRVARADYYPKLNLTFTLAGDAKTLYRQVVNGTDQLPSSQRALSEQLGDQTNYTVALTLSFNVFDRFLTRLNTARARLVANNAALDYDDTRNQVVADVRQVLADLGAARQQALATRQTVASAQKAYDTVSARYRVGASSFLDVLSAQAALTQAQAADAQATTAVQLQRKLLEYVTGQYNNSTIGH